MEDECFENQVKQRKDETRARKTETENEEQQRKALQQFTMPEDFRDFQLHIEIPLHQLAVCCVLTNFTQGISVCFSLFHISPQEGF